jgi:hypothetical protein
LAKPITPYSLAGHNSRTVYIIKVESRFCELSGQSIYRQDNVLHSRGFKPISRLSKLINVRTAAAASEWRAEDELDTRVTALRPYASTSYLWENLGPDRGTRSSPGCEVLAVIYSRSERLAKGRQITFQFWLRA